MSRGGKKVFVSSAWLNISAKLYQLDLYDLWLYMFIYYLSIILYIYRLTVMSFEYTSSIQVY